MSMFCLVHGSTQDPQGWELLAAELKVRGHECICVDLPTDQPDSRATVYARDWWEVAARQRLHTEPIRIEAGHAPHVSRPVALATILDSLATC